PLFEALVRLTDCGEDLQGRQDAVAGRSLVEEEDVPGLLSTEAQALCLELFEDVAVTDLYAPDADSPFGQVALHAEVAHLGGDDLLLAAGDGADSEHLVTADEAATPVDEQGTVGVAVEGDPDLEAAFEDPL